MTGQVDAVVVGGGLAGLYCARRLAAAGRSWVLLEATGRLGGRILAPPGPPAVDLGPTWFWPHQGAMQGLLAALHIPWFDQHVAGDALYELQPDAPPVRFEGAGAMISHRVRGGMQSVVDRLAADLGSAGLHLGHPVVGLERTAGRWRVTAAPAGGPVTFEAGHLLLAAPPRVLLAHLDLESLLPQDLVRRLAGTPTWMAGQAKLVATYRRPFWREAGLAGDAFSRVGPLVEVHDACADGGAGYALFGFIGLPARARSALTNDDLEARCIAQLGNLFGPEALRPEATFLKDWSRDPWVATPPDLDEPSRHPELDLRPYKEHLAGLGLAFAGTEAAAVDGGLLEGALMAAEAAVANVIGGPPAR